MNPSRAWHWLAENRRPLALVTLAAALVAGFLVSFYAPPGSRIGKAQPIPFSHRLHVNVKAIQCQYCHSYVGYSSHPGLPPVEKCLHCHNHIIANHFWIKEEHRYFDTGTPLPWRKVNDLPEHVAFNHQRHIRFGIDCPSCHGAVETMDRIEGKRFRMGFCIECHQLKKVNLDCWLACHN